MKEKIFDKDVDIVLGSVLVGDETIEDYIAKLKEENERKQKEGIEPPYKRSR